MPSLIAAPPNLPVAPTAPPAAPGAPPNLPAPAPTQASAQPPPAGAQGAWKEALHPRGRGGKWIVSKGDGYGAAGPNETTKQLQQRLNQLGYKVPVDGKFGVSTEMAVKAFQAKYGLAASGGVDTATMQFLRNPAGSADGPAQTYAQAVAAKAASPAGKKAAAAKKKAAASKKIAATKKAAAASKGTTSTRSRSTGSAGSATAAATAAPGGHFVIGPNGQPQLIHAVGKNKWAPGPPPATTGSTTGTGVTKTPALNAAIPGLGHLGQGNLQQGAGMTGPLSPAVKNLQLALASQGIKLNADGRFGPQTQAAVMNLQRQYGLTQDGIVGPATKGLLVGLMTAQSGTKGPSLASIASKTAAASKKAAAKVPALPPQTAHAMTKQGKPPRTKGASSMTLTSGKRIQKHTKLHHAAPAAELDDGLRALVEHDVWAHVLQEHLLGVGWGYQPSLSIKDHRSEGEPENDLPVWDDTGSHAVAPDLAIPDSRDVPTPNILERLARTELAEAVKARKAATDGFEFARALARERVLRERAERTAPERLTEAQLDALAQPALEAMRLEESAKTAGYSVTPHPFGKPGGPGLWHHKGLGLPAYITNVAHGIQKSGKSESESIAAAISVVKRWATGGAKVHPEVRAAAAKALAEWTALKASHGGGRTKSAAKAAAK